MLSVEVSTSPFLTLVRIVKYLNPPNHDSHMDILLCIK